MNRFYSYLYISLYFNKKTHKTAASSRIQFHERSWRYCFHSRTLYSHIRWICILALICTLSKDTHTHTHTLHMYMYYVYTSWFRKTWNILVLLVCCISSPVLYRKTEANHLLACSFPKALKLVLSQKHWRLSRRIFSDYWFPKVAGSRIGKVLFSSYILVTALGGETIN